MSPDPLLAGGVWAQDYCDEEQDEEKGPLVVIPYVAGMSEDIRRVCREFNIRVVFKSGWTLRSMLTRSRIHYLLVSNPMWYIVSPAAAARSTSGRQDGDWRRD